jgi:hypothetical protein
MKLFIIQFFSNVLLFHPPSMQIFYCILSSQSPPYWVLPLMWESEVQIHTKLRAKL